MANETEQPKAPATESPLAQSLLLDWKRCIVINDEINDELLKKLSVPILELRQQSSNPITVAIDSYGGALPTVDSLLGLMRGPMQGGDRCRINTIVTNRAYSAAATFLSLGDYAVAFPHAEILFHDVRYDGLRDVTPSKARETAKTLNALNESYALRLARKVMPRLVWNYVCLIDRIPNYRTILSTTAADFDNAVSKYSVGTNPGNVDFSGFALVLWGMLSIGNDQIIKEAIKKLKRWIENRVIEQSIPPLRPKGTRTPGLLDGAAHLYTKLRQQKNYAKEELNLGEAQLSDLSLLVALAVGRLADSPSGRTRIDELLEGISADYAVSKSFDDARHMSSISQIMIDHGWTFFRRDISVEIEGKEDDERAAILSPAIPIVRLFWFFCVFLCRTLFEGDHVLSPDDARLLGLIDEVCGGGPIQSVREYVIARN
jgi:ATP-dependent protease ClpP protease subunit